MGQSYYEVLGVSPDATSDEIKAAYRNRVFETHPDHNDDPDAAEQFRAVETAESVLCDEVERARYDRLGHEAYVSDSPYISDSDTDGWTSTTESSGPSHHARQRRRREQAQAQWTENGEYWFGEERTGTAGAGFNHSTVSSTTETTDPGGFSYSVHDWDGTVSPQDTRPRLGQSTLVALAAIASIYPIFVYSSLAPAFPLFINGVVAVLTLLLIGYILTMPRIAVTTFGWWSLAATVTFLVAPPVEPLSLLGGVAMGFFWIPFGYALAVWWALRP